MPRMPQRPQKWADPQHPLTKKEHPNAPTLRNKLLMLPAKFIVRLPVTWSLSQSRSPTISLLVLLLVLSFALSFSASLLLPLRVFFFFCCCYFSCSALGKLVLCGCLPRLLFLLEILLLPISGKHTHTHITVFRRVCVSVCVLCAHLLSAFTFILWKFHTIY